MKAGGKGGAGPRGTANDVRSARLVERRIYCTDKLLAGWKFADAHSSHSGRPARR